ncbi:MAG: DUF1223 domain-containing protein [Methylovirgula sp.]
MSVSFRQLSRCGSVLVAVAMCEASFAQGLRANPVVPTHIDSVVELFTSQGCSSCPPADHLLSSMARAPNVVAVSFPIDYWDFIGWQDTLASPSFTARQKAYAAARGDGHVYTPQAIVDGLADAVGSDRVQLEHAIRSNKGRDGALSVPIHLTETPDVLHIDVGAGPIGEASVYVLRVIKSKTVVIGRGENSGRSITYTNVVRAIRKIGDWNGGARSYDLSELKGDNEGYVVLLQRGSERHPGAILAAAKSPGL